MTREAPDRDWIREGAQVAEYAGSYAARPASATVTTVARLTAKQIVLANGSRYRSSDLRKIGESTGPWAPPTVLLPADDVQVRVALAERRLRGALAKVRKAVDKPMPCDPVTAVGWLDEIEQAVRLARAVITDDDMARAARVAAEKG